ncbi:MAG: hypothetical protein K9W44_16215 [Candidatus Lokiarchaeota archaeon]|nr:hypothetical protein [Candidatus Harpocratesius repetitus]
MLKKTFPKKGKDYSELKSDKYVQRWLENISSKTHNQKLAVFQKFLNFVEKSPEELILEHSKDLTEIDPIKRSNIAKRQLNAYFQFLKGEHNSLNSKMNSKPISHNSARIKVYSMILGFYARNHVKIQFDRGEIPAEEKKGITDKVWRNGKDSERISNEDKKDWLKKIYNQFSTAKNKAIFLCMKSSGLDPVDLFNLTISDYHKGYFKKYSICYVEGNRSKTKETFQTFFDSEACDALYTYMKERKRRGENLQQNSWLFVVDKKNKNGEYRKMFYTRFAIDLKAVCEILELKNITTKRIRAWFDSNVKKGLDAELLTVSERMMGHKTDITAKYQQILKDTEEFAKFYKDEIEPKLLILGRSEYVKKINEDIESLQNTIQLQAEKITKIEAENKEMKKILEDRLQKSEKNMQKMMKIIENLQKDMKKQILS